MLYVKYGFTNNKHILHKASMFVHAHINKSIINLKMIHSRLILKVAIIRELTHGNHAINLD